MTSEFTGDVSFEAQGKPWTLKMGTKAMRKIEVASGKPMTIVGRELGNEATATIELVATVFWGALQHYHPDLTMDQCDDIMDEIGLGHVGPLINEAFEAAQPKKTGGETRPPKATTGPTGRRS